MGKPTALIMGISGAIGKACAGTFLRKGYLVHGAGRSNPSIENIKFTTCDIRENSQVKILADEFNRNSIDVLIVTSGISPVVSAVRTTPETFTDVISTNLCGVANTVRCIYPKMTKTGVIFLFGSRLGFHPETGALAYSTSKAAMTGLVQSLAMEICRKGMRIHLIIPPLIESEMTKYIKGDKHSPESAADEIISIMSRTSSSTIYSFDDRPGIVSW